MHLANTLDAELEDSGVIAFSIGPGLVPTETASNAIAKLAPSMGMSVDEFFSMNKNAVLTIEEAGAGFAVSIVFAEKFRGQEISSMQALKAADINFGAEEIKFQINSMNAEDREQAWQLCERVRTTLKDQSDGWKRRSLFERQWVIRDFKKTAGMPVEEWLDALSSLQKEIQTNTSITHPPLEKLAGYYAHLAELAKGYEKILPNSMKTCATCYGWMDEVEKLNLNIMQFKE